MKKILLIALLFIIVFLSLSFSYNDSSYLKTYFDEEEIKYIKENNIDYAEYYEYLRYKNFSIYDLNQYKSIREINNSPLEAINTVYNKYYYDEYINISPAIFLNRTYILVNKHYYLEETYKPSNLININTRNIDYIIRENEEMLIDYDVLNELDRLILDSKNEGLNLTVFSAYRDYNKQKKLYYEINNQNDYTCARPGHSEHQTGLAIDISTRDTGLTNYFIQTKEYQWLTENAHKYGFIERYKSEYSDKTHYVQEPWHFRYVGKEIAGSIYLNNISLEEYIIRNIEI